MIQDLVAGTRTAFSFPFERGAMHIAGIAVSPAGDRLVLETGGSSTARFTYTYILSRITGQMVTPVLEHGGPMHWADFSPDGRRVLTTGLTPYVRVWNAESGEQLMQLDLGSQPVRVAQWSLDGRFIVARSDERAARVWDSTTGEAVTPIFKHASEVRYAILAQQNRLITLSQPDLISVWELKECELPLDVITDYAKFLSGRYLNVNGVLMELKSTELAELGRSLRHRAPKLFD
jgi:WD40 repeat protein